MLNPSKKPTVDSRHMALGIDGAWDVFRKLEWEVESYRQAASQLVAPGSDAATRLRIPLYIATNAASTAWSLIEWTWFEIEPNPAKRAELMERWKVSIDDLRSIKNGAKAICSDVDASFNIAHAAKHAQLATGTVGFSTPHFFEFFVDSNNNPSATQTALIEMTYGDGNHGTQTVLTLLNSLVRWWRHELTELKIPDRLFLIPGSDPTVR